MRNNDLNETITRADVKVGDKIRISREFVVTTACKANIGSVDATVVTADGKDTLALTDKESVTLLERDEKLDFTDAEVVTWKTDQGERFFGVWSEDAESWYTSDDDTYGTSEQLEQDILTDAFGDGEYEEGSFEVLFPKPKPKLSSGGFGPGGHSITDVLSRAAATPTSYRPHFSGRFA